MPINHDMMHAQTRPMFEKAGEVLEGVAKLKERVAELEADNKRLENAVDVYKSKANVFKCQVAEISMKLCESKNYKAVCRALWLARAERAVAEQTIDEWSRYREKHPFGSWRVDPFKYWVQAWINVEKLCRKKAKEYK